MHAGDLPAVLEPDPMDAQRSHRTHARGQVVPTRSRPRRSHPQPLRHNPFTAGQQAARLEFLAFQVNAIRAEIQAARASAPAGCVDRLARIVGALETEAALIEAGPDAIEGAA